MHAHAIRWRVPWRVCQVQWITGRAREFQMRRRSWNLRQSDLRVRSPICQKSFWKGSFAILDKNLIFFFQKESYNVENHSYYSPNNFDDRVYCPASRGQSSHVADRQCCGGETKPFLLYDANVKSCCDGVVQDGECWNMRNFKTNFKTKFQDEISRRNFKTNFYAFGQRSF